ncbi:RagB/SusD family nutrient uptake outer membrane protein [Segetibacter sp. 3557_3]|uniref:RagB/SusD family nutrient uptake outer membrane protein n=1 Tax=Segetibacter sp. 3557_3 TaxID=2547429 RepID=UPI001058E87A|nr:RagB/SusD family nutrient uptake outer membrane protein [Segetibacter sp. 3557_3]TDH21414.1 RagB/SusD family nutrient uptake outer membrane protein [Segetibacter sp. 3557_3]
MKRFIIYIFILTAVTQPGCKTYVEVPPPQNQLVSQLVFSDDKTATATVTGLYSTLNGFNSSFANFIGNILPAAAADEFFYSLSSADLDEFRDNNIISGNSYINNAWTSAYSYIYHANAILEGLESATGVSAPVKQQLRSEAKFIRAFCYFYLVNYFGDVPLIVDTDYKKNTALARNKVDEVYAMIVSSLLEAQAEISDAYPGAERTRANKAVVTALLARVYLYTQQWSKAEAEATKVINDSRYQLLTDLSRIFLKNSNEALWQLQTVNTSTAGVNTWEGFSIVPAAAGGASLYHVHPSFLTAFEPNDKRRTNWITSYTNASGTFFYPFKYKVRTKTPVEEYSMVLRFAEMYLVRAEARAQQDNLGGAKGDVDVIRARAGIPLLPGNLSKSAMLLQIEQERRVELFAEWGHRWHDLRRTGRAFAVLSPLKPSLQQTDLLYPIPLNAIITNPNLTQNPGYN